MNIHSLENRAGWKTPDSKRESRNQQNVFSTLLGQAMQGTEKDSIRITDRIESQDSASIRNSKISSQPAAISERLTVQQPEVISISGTYQERLEQLRKLNAETDWASMSDTEKVRTFEDRYRQAFGADNFFHVAGWLRTPYSKQDKEIYSSYLEEKQKYFNSQQGIAKTESAYIDSYREAYYGNMTDQEVRAAIRERWQGSGSMEDKFAILVEYSKCGVDGEIDGIMMNQIHREIYNKAVSLIRPTLQGTQMSPSDSPRFGAYFMSCAQGVGEGAGFSLNWTQLAQSVMDSYGNMVQPNEENSISLEELERIKGMLDDFLNEISGKE